MGIFSGNSNKNLTDYVRKEIQRQGGLPQRDMICPYCGTRQRILGAGTVTCRKCHRQFG